MKYVVLLQKWLIFVFIDSSPRQIARTVLKGSIFYFLGKLVGTIVQYVHLGLCEPPSIFNNFFNNISKTLSTF